MASTSPGGHPSEASFLELNQALAAARDALLLFADSEGVLGSLVCDPAEPDCRFPDLAAVRRSVTVDELLHLISGIPPDEEDIGTSEANGLYPTLLELAEVFDLLIDQYSLVYGDAVALAESMEAGWHAMAGSLKQDLATADAETTARRIEANVAALAPVLDALARLSPQARREVTARFERDGWLPWRSEARHLASNSVVRWLPLRTAATHPQMMESIQAALAAPSRPDDDRGAAGHFSRAVGDLVLATLVRGIARDVVVDALDQPFAGIVPRT